MRSDEHTQGVGFVFRLKYVLAKPWFIKNNKYIQDWPRGQPSKSSTSSGVMKKRDRRSLVETARIGRSPTNQPDCPGPQRLGVGPWLQGDELGVFSFLFCVLADLGLLDSVFMFLTDLFILI